MKWMRIAATVSTFAIAGMASSLASAQQCKQTCNTSYQQCLSGGHAENFCLGTWHQCKAGCDGAKYAAYTPAKAPVAVKPAIQAKAVVGKHR
jgi:hypothetical protein